MPGSSSGHPGARGSLQSPPPFAGRGCFECGDLGHIKRFCPRLTGGIISVCHEDAYVLFDPGSIISYVLSYFARYLGTPRESLVSSIHISTPVCDTIVVDCVYRSSVVTIRGLDTRVDLLLLSMVDFDVILGIDWLSPCHAILDCHANMVTLAMPGVHGLSGEVRRIMFPIE
ncbi:uncharacterized protein [Nicotiana sylvestris]|uniref:uncharacterized protein n=1 Tax=Nicotiana sylvestris TaxID=4096 RepID=UPI00388C4FAA